MSEIEPELKRQIAREVRQRLESLRRAGVDGLPKSTFRPSVSKARVEAIPQSQPVMEVAIVATVEEAPPPPKKVEAPIVKRPVPIAPGLFGDPGFEEAVVPPEERPARLAALAERVAACERCPLLASTRIQTVFGSGSPTARLLFIGEAPGAEEDRTGMPFVGKAGMLLTDMITKGMGLTRDEVYIANILKSRPPENRNPLPDEIKHCLPFLEEQIAIIRPEFICMLGKVAASSLLDTMLPIGKLRGKWHRYRGIATVVTYHPSYLLREPSAKKAAWDDLQMLMQAMGLKVPSKKKSGGEG